jgi:hypothetical protein
VRTTTKNYLQVVDQSYLDITSYQKDVEIGTLSDGSPNVIDLLYTNEGLAVYPSSDTNIDAYGLFVGDDYN